MRRVQLAVYLLLALVFPGRSFIERTARHGATVWGPRIQTALLLRPSPHFHSGHGQVRNQGTAWRAMLLKSAQHDHDNGASEASQGSTEPQRDNKDGALSTLGEYFDDTHSTDEDKEEEEDDETDYGDEVDENSEGYLSPLVFFEEGDDFLEEEDEKLGQQVEQKGLEIVHNTKERERQIDEALYQNFHLATSKGRVGRKRLDTQYPGTDRTPDFLASEDKVTFRQKELDILRSVLPYIGPDDPLGRLIRAKTEHLDSREYHGDNETGEEALGEKGVEREEIASGSTELTDGAEEVVITLPELQALWKRRSKLPWGMPSEKFDEKQALLLLGDGETGVDAAAAADDDDDVDDDEEDDETSEKKVTVLDIPLDSKAAMTADKSTFSNWKEQKGEWSTEEDFLAATRNGTVTSAYSGTVSAREDLLIGGLRHEDYASSDEVSPDMHTLQLHEYLKRISPGSDLRSMLRRQYLKDLFDELDSSNIRPASTETSYIPRGATSIQSHMLQGDIESQEFEGNLMLGNTYATPRIPANWDDPASGGRSALHRAFGTLAPPTDSQNGPQTSASYDIYTTSTVPIWEALNLTTRDVAELREKALASMQMMDSDSSRSHRFNVSNNNNSRTNLDMEDGNDDSADKAEGLNVALWDTVQSRRRREGWRAPFTLLPPLQPGGYTRVIYHEDGDNEVAADEKMVAEVGITAEDKDETTTARTDWSTFDFAAAEQEQHRERSIALQQQAAEREAVHESHTASIDEKDRVGMTDRNAAIPRQQGVDSINEGRNSGDDERMWHPTAPLPRNHSELIQRIAGGTYEEAFELLHQLQQVSGQEQMQELGIASQEHLRNTSARDTSPRLNGLLTMNITERERSWYSNLLEALRLNTRTGRAPHMPWKLVRSQELDEQYERDKQELLRTNSMPKTLRPKLQSLKSQHKYRTWHNNTLRYFNKLLGAGGESGTALPLPWYTPTDLLEQEEYRHHVGFDVWSKYNSSDFFGADDELWDEDVQFADAICTINKATDQYMCNHVARAERINIARAEQRIFDAAVAKACGRNYTTAKISNGTKLAMADPRLLLETRASPELADLCLEPIPPHFTPDLDRGVEYTDELIEMKSKMSLMPKQLEPAVEWANDTFTHATDVVTLNTIGTLREQYDWQPPADRDPASLCVEPEVVARLGPLLRFVNYAADLQSTTNNTLIFDYHGPVKHVIGLRSHMLTIARSCLPELGEALQLRLETSRTHDPQSVS